MNTFNRIEKGSFEGVYQLNNFALKESKLLAIEKIT